MTLASGGLISLCDPPVSVSVRLASSAVTPAGFVHKSRGDNVVQLKRCGCHVCECYKGGIVGMVVI